MGIDKFREWFTLKKKKKNCEWFTFKVPTMNGHISIVYMYSFIFDNLIVTTREEGFEPWKTSLE